MSRILPFLVAGLLAVATPCLAQPHPYGGEVFDLLTEVETLRSGPTVEARTRAAETLLTALYRDPFLAKLGPAMKLESFLSGVAKGEAFDVQAFRAAAQNAVATSKGITTHDVGATELLQKLQVIEIAITAPRQGPGAARGPPIDADAVARSEVRSIFPGKDTKVMSMEPVRGASVLMVNEHIALPSGASREAVALDLYGRMLVKNGPGHGVLRAGLAHKEVGRAVLGPARTHPAGASTADVLKGVGPTPYANNQFNSKATGTFPLPEAVRDWTATEALRKAGVAVYEPVAIVMLPYMEWSKSEGWRPIAVYVRRPRENLRVSDLADLSTKRKRALVASLKGKIEAELKAVGRGAPISEADVIRTFVERAGRTAGIFQGGMGKGTYYFHGMLHDQNVSLLGEIVDVGNGDGRLKSREAMLEAWKASNYAWWPDKLADYKGMRGNVETVLFHRMARLVNAGLAPVADGGLSEAELNEIFRRAYREGRQGKSAADPRRTLTIRAPDAAPRAAKALDPYRRADGTLKWRELTRDHAKREGAGLAQFTLALFLKEVAAVAATGDRARIDEFFEGLLTTDFYKQYGLFVAGARVGEVAYTRYLQRYIKPRFLNGMLKTNLVLASGMALPLIAEGKFEGKAFAISVASLGLSSAAVKTGVAGIKWVVDLKQAKRVGKLARLGANAGRLAKLGGWFYTAAELAVVLYLADTIETRVNAHLDLAKARGELAAAGQAFLTASRTQPTPQALERAAEVYHQAWNDYRNFLYRPLHVDEAVFADRIAKTARKAKLLADERTATLAQLEKHSALKANILRRHGSIDAYAEHLAKQNEAALQKQVTTYVDSYDKNRAEHLRAVYEDGRRGQPLLRDVEHLDWLLRGAAVSAQGDPYGARRDVLARLGRSRVRDDLADALGGASTNRLEAYDDEAEVLAAIATSLRARGQPHLAQVLETQRAAVSRLQGLDRQLIQGDGIVDTAKTSLAKRVQEFTHHR